LGYRVLEHPADLWIEVTGKNIQELFAGAGEALFDLLLEAGRIELRESKSFSLSAGSVEELLRDWLSELNYLNQVEGWLFGSFDIRELSGSRLAADARGEKFDPERHRISREIKAVTYHDLMVDCSDSGCVARVLFDI
jgi:SHS2 domain-containing protein